MRSGEENEGVVFGSQPRFNVGGGSWAVEELLRVVVRQVEKEFIVDPVDP